MIDGLDEPAFRSLHNSVHFMIGGDAQSFNWCITFTFALPQYPLISDIYLGWREPRGMGGKSSVPTTLSSYVVHMAGHLLCSL